MDRSFLFYDSHLFIFRRRFRHVDVVCDSKFLHVWMGKGEKGGGGRNARGIKMGQLTLSMGPARAEVCFLIQRAIIQSKRVIFNVHL
jgi:hypothetical protein